MKKGFILAALAAVQLAGAASTLFATDPLLPDAASPKQYVTVRKFLMGTQGALAGDIAAKLNAGNVKAVVSSARGIAATSLFIPLLFKDTYSDVYPVAGDKFFFKGAAIADVTAGAAALNAAAESLMAIADGGDKAATQAQFAKVQAACGACHTPFRGQY